MTNYEKIVVITWKAKQLCLDYGKLKSPTPEEIEQYAAEYKAEKKREWDEIMKNRIGDSLPSKPAKKRKSKSEEEFDEFEAVLSEEI